MEGFPDGFTVGDTVGDSVGVFDGDDVGTSEAKMLGMDDRVAVGL